MNEIVTAATETAAPVVSQESATASVLPIIATAPEVTSPVASPAANVAPITDAEIVAYLKKNDPLTVRFLKLVEETVNNINFLKDDSWIEHAINGLEKPNLETRIESQTETHAKKDLIVEAAQKAADGEPFVAPTPQKIAEEVQKRMQKRRDEIKKKQDRKIAAARAVLAKK